MEGVLILSAKRVSFVKKRVLSIWRVKERNPLRGGVLCLLKGRERPLEAHSMGPEGANKKRANREGGPLRTGPVCHVVRQKKGWGSRNAVLVELPFRRPGRLSGVF